MISDTAVDFAKQTVAFLFNETLWKDASDHAMAYVRKHFSLSAQAQDLESIISVAYNSKVSLEMTSDIL